MRVGFAAAHAGEVFYGKQNAAVPQSAAGLFPESCNLLRCSPVGASVHTAADVQYWGKIKIKAQFPDIFSGLVCFRIRVFRFACCADCCCGRRCIGILFHPGHQPSFLIYRKEKRETVRIQGQIFQGSV